MSRPNVLLIHCHDLGQFLGCYGIPTVQTPRIDRLAAEGVRFRRMFCTAPQCSPSRASLFTGRWPHSNGVLGLCHRQFQWDLNPDERHLGQILRDAGYRTAGVGTIHETRSGPERCGLDEYLAGAAAAQVGESTPRLLESLAADERPFYLQAGIFEPHRVPGPNEPDYMGFLGTHHQPDDSRGVTIPGYLRDTPGSRAEFAEVQGAVKAVDQAVGRILDRLRELDLERDTLTIFTADHGLGMPRAKCSVYEPGLQVPLILRLPGRDGWHGGAVRDELVSNLDVVPTLLDLLDIPAPDNVQGISHRALLDGDAYAPRTEVFGELTYHQYYDPRRSIRTETHKLIVSFSNTPFFMDPSQSWRPRCDTIVPEDPARGQAPLVQLYDLRDDPWEQRDLGGDESHAAVREELLARLYRHLVATDDPILDGLGRLTPPVHRQALDRLRAAAG